MSLVSIKLQINNDLRRVKIAPTISFADFKVYLQNLFKEVPEADWNSVSLKYRDDENDYCTISTQDELAESFSAKQGSILKIEISFSKQPQPQGFTNFQPQQPQFPHQRGFRCHSREPRSFPLRNNAPSSGDRPPFFLRKITLHEEGIALMESKDYEGAKAIFLQLVQLLHCPWKKSSALYNVACCEALLGNTDSALVYLSQAINNGFRNVRHIETDEDLASLRGFPAFQTLVSELSSKEESRPNKDCHRINRFQIFALHEDGIALLESKDYEGAKAIFQQILERLPERCQGKRNGAFYNIACCEALLGNADSALVYLTQAINNGFRNVRHIETDEDLASLRQLPAFQTLISEISRNQNDENRPFSFNKDCNRPDKLRKHGLHEAAIALMESKDYEGAKAIFHELNQLGRCPGKKKHVFYNIACCEALLGNSASALSFLSQCVESGFKNSQRMASDINLLSLRELPEFQKLIADIQSNPRKGNKCGFKAEKHREESVPVATGETLKLVFTPTEIQPAVEKVAEFSPVTSPFQDSLASLVQMGFTNVEENLAVLKKKNGNLAAAVEQLLSGRPLYH